MSARKLIVTHHSPDLDAITAVWLLKRFGANQFASAKVAFVNPGSQISAQQAEQFHVLDKDIVHVDTGFGEFDHHQPERAKKHISASSLVYDYVCDLHPELQTDSALREIVTFTTQIDHFQEIEWPDPANYRYGFMIHELISGIESVDPHNDESQLHFGIQCLNCAYANLVNKIKADEIIQEKGQKFSISFGDCLGLETRNDETIKRAQMKGYILVVRKDPKLGHVRIKVRPDAPFDLDKVYQNILAIDSTGTWFYHGSGKMLLNGSGKHLDQKPSPLSLQQVIQCIKKSF